LKVVHLVAGNLYGGVEAFLATLARFREAAPAMAQHFALCFPGRLRRELDQAGAPVLDLGKVRASRPWTVLRARSRLKAFVEREAPEVLVAHGAWAHALLTPRAGRASVVYFQHDAAGAKDWPERLARLSPPTQVIANSEFTASTTHHLFPRAKPEIYRYPVPQIPALGDEDRARLRSELQVEPTQALIIQTSRIEPWKGQRCHLRVLGKLKDDPGWVSVIAGGPQRPKEERYYAELKEMAHELGIVDRVRFIGQRSDVPRLLRAADIHFQPNQGPEPFGIAFIEAMLAGLPVVTFRLGALGEYVAAESGILSDDEEGLVEGLRRLIGQPATRREMGKNAQSSAEALCDPERQVQSLQALLDRTKLRAEFQQRHTV
jgi:glycosyltransferase involved in cell wall biosynthesis